MAIAVCSAGGTGLLAWILRLLARPSSYVWARIDSLETALEDEREHSNKQDQRIARQSEKLANLEQESRISRNRYHAMSQTILRLELDNYSLKAEVNELHAERGRPPKYTLGPKPVAMPLMEVQPAGDEPTEG